MHRCPNLRWLFPVSGLLVVAACGTRPNPDFAPVARLVNDVRVASFPGLRDADISIHALQSEYIFLETRFTFTSYFFGGRLRYMLFFNDEATRRHVPVDGLRAIIAHELAHIDYYQTQSRMGLAGLARLLSPSFNMRFERRADLKAIELGYGPGLQIYRAWLYRNVPPERMVEKKRDYFSPEEIAAILRVGKTSPQFMRELERCVPQNEAEIESLAKHPHMRCRD